MGSHTSLWSRWRALAHRAAQVQANVVFFLLYYVAIVPMGLLRLGGPSALKRPRGVPSWSRRNTTATDLHSARRQF